MEILPQLLINALISGSIYALASSGMSLSFGLLKILNFAHGHLMMLGVYLFYYFNSDLALSIPTASLITFLLSILVAAFTLEVFVLPFCRFSFILTLVSTLALSNILESGVSMTFGVNVKSLDAGPAMQSIEFWGIFITPIQIIIIASSIIILGIIALIVHKSMLGRRIRALSENSYAAEALGVSKINTSYLVYITAVVLAAFAGVLVGYETNMQPTMGTAYTVKAFAAMILGGLGNFWGTIISSYILGLVENLSIGLDFGGYSIPAGYKDAFAFMIILLVLLFKPEGIFSKKRRKT